MSFFDSFGRYKGILLTSTHAEVAVGVAIVLMVLYGDTLEECSLVVLI